jgi:hypothetical protein
MERSSIRLNVARAALRSLSNQRDPLSSLRFAIAIPLTCSKNDIPRFAKRISVGLPSMLLGRIAHMFPHAHVGQLPANSYFLLIDIEEALNRTCLSQLSQLKGA